MRQFFREKLKFRGKSPKIWCVKGKHLMVLGCVLAAAVMFGVVNHPAIVGAAAATRELPIYCVQRDQKMASLSFDAAWGNVIIRPLPPKVLRETAAVILRRIGMTESKRVLGGRFNLRSGSLDIKHAVVTTTSV